MASENEKAVEKTTRRSGSERRQKCRRITFRLTPDEYENLSASAREAGLTTGSFIRARTLVIAQTRSRRRPPVDLERIARLHAEMNRVGSNIHQILKRVNFGDTPLKEEFHDALAGYREVIDAILVALGRKQSHDYQRRPEE